MKVQKDRYAGRQLTLGINRMGLSRLRPTIPRYLHLNSSKVQHSFRYLPCHSLATLWLSHPINIPCMLATLATLATLDIRGCPTLIQLLGMLSISSSSHLSRQHMQLPKRWVWPRGTGILPCLLILRRIATCQCMGNYRRHSHSSSSNSSSSAMVASNLDLRTMDSRCAPVRSRWTRATTTADNVRLTAQSDRSRQTLIGRMPIIRATIGSPHYRSQCRTNLMHLQSQICGKDRNLMAVMISLLSSSSSISHRIAKTTCSHRISQECPSQMLTLLRLHNFSRRSIGAFRCRLWEHTILIVRLRRMKRKARLSSGRL